jgi:methyl-accepting chemotaxis protein
LEIILEVVMVLRDMSVSRRLGLGFSLVSALLLLIIVLGIEQHAVTEGRMIEITKINDVEIRLAQIADLTVTERAPMGYAI